MKTKFTFLIIFAFSLAFSVNIKAQIPQAINFQAIARDASGNVMANTDIQIQLSVVDSAAGGIVVYKELRALTTNAYGSFSFQIGIKPYSVITGTMEGINWATGKKYLKIDYDPTNKLQFNLTLGTIQFVTVPYAFTAGTVNKIDVSNAVNGNVLMYNSTTGNFEPKALDYVSLSGSQTITGNKIFSGTVSVVTPVNKDDAVNKAYVDQLKQQIKELQQVTGIYQIKDTDGNYYKVRKIGTQVWMAENLKTTKYCDGTPITNITDNSDWNSLTTEAYCWYNNNILNKDTFGALYNYYTVINSHKLCPAGWHVPTATEWATLESYLGGQSIAGGKLKEAGTAHWLAPNTGGDNVSGFMALPGGYRHSGFFNNIHAVAEFLSSDQTSATLDIERFINFNETGLGHVADYKSNGVSVRCISD
jgi:uncharacterized protein (TIGR02145 family)